MGFFFAITSLIFPIATVYLLVDHFKLKSVVRNLRLELRTMRDREAKRDEEAETPPSETPAAAKQDPRPAQAETPQPSVKPEKVAETPAADPQSPPRTYVLGTENIGNLTSWLKENWFYVAAAVSLALAGIFLVQYSIENGLLSPRNRVLSALIFGVALIGAGEWIRRRGGDSAEDLTAFLPSTFAGAGVVTLFSATIFAQRLYGLIGPEMAYAGLVAIAVLAIILGWVYGPFLTAIGIIGASAVPFSVTSGSTENISWLFYYYALIAVIGLSVDAMKRSAWISAIAIAAPYFGATFLWMAASSEGLHYLAFAGIVAIAAICIPTLSQRPAFGGAMTFRVVHFQGAPGWPEFPTRLAAGGLLALCAVAVLTPLWDATLFWLTLGILFVALYAIAFWLDRTAVLDDLALPILAAMIAIIWLHGMHDLDIAKAFRTAVVNVDHPMPQTMMALTGFGLVVSALLGRKSLRDTPLALGWTIAAAAFAPAVVILLGWFWQPLSQLSKTYWAFHVMAVAALMTVLAERTIHKDGEDRLRTAFFALAALNMIAFAMTIVLTETALTLGLAALVVSGAWLDRKFDVRPVTWLVQLGIITCSYRLIIDPGLPWALRASLPELCTGYLGVVILLAAAWWLLQARARTGAIIIAESAGASLLGIFASVLIYRALPDDTFNPHWVFSLFGMVWLICAAAQLYRTQISGLTMQMVRSALAALFGMIGLFLLALSLTFGNPLLYGEVEGPPIVDSLLAAYLLPALLMLLVAWRFTHLYKWLRVGLVIVAIIPAAMYIGLEIRRLWHGPNLTAPGTLDGELYTYTIAMLLIGSVLLGLAFLRRSVILRRISVCVIALTIAKVFLIDMSGLEGLMRALSFLALGLVLAGLALLNRWMTRTLSTEA